MNVNLFSFDPLTNSLQNLLWKPVIKIHYYIILLLLLWRHNGCEGVSNHRRLDCVLDRLFRCRSKKTSKLRVAGLCEGDSPVTGEFPAQRASDAENIPIWWRHHDGIESYWAVKWSDVWYIQVSTNTQTWQITIHNCKRIPYNIKNLHSPSGIIGCGSIITFWSQVITHGLTPIEA